ncbi:MAG TPA: hypothetical protein VEG60_18215 [Candidatus Binatia bacterium]|nr:hypothetical protein [Candidatus Binatia bacterium]
MQAEDSHRDGTREAAGHELSDLRPGYVGVFAIAIAIVIGAAVVITSLLMNYRAVQHARRDAPVPPLAREREATPQLRLQVDAPGELRQMRQAEEAVLTSYGWVDKDAGIVRIPVDRAMEILAKKGLPARKREEKKK